MGTIQYTIYPEIKLVHFRGTGEVSYELLMSKIRELHKDPDWEFNFNTFVDFEDALVQLDVGGLTQYTEFFERLQESATRRKWAIYTSRRETHMSANMSHMLQTISINVDVFTDRTDALAFLDLTPEQFDEVVSRTRKTS